MNYSTLSNTREPHDAPRNPLSPWHPWKDGQGNGHPQQGQNMVHAVLGGEHHLNVNVNVGKKPKDSKQLTISGVLGFSDPFCSLYLRGPLTQNCTSSVGQFI